MYLSIRKYAGATDRDEVIRRVENGLVPQFKEMPGFVAYYGVAFDDGDLGGVNVFDTKENADDANRKVGGWVKENLAGLLPNEPAVHRGEVLFNAGAKSIGKTA